MTLKDAARTFIEAHTSLLATTGDDVSQVSNTAVAEFVAACDTCSDDGSDVDVCCERHDEQLCDYCSSKNHEPQP